jgi:RNA polymerase sigma-70 factor (ECF subfamily)
MTAAEYNKCVTDYADALYRFILKSIKDSDKAKDIIQDTFEKMWIKSAEINPEKAKSYLFTAAYRTMIDSIRKEKKQAEFSEADLNKLSHTPQNFDVQKILHKAIDLLPEDQRAVILLRDYEGYSYEEIQQITGLSLSQVKVYIFRARVFLKKYIGSKEVLV